MAACSSCGAPLSPGLSACSFCRAPTALALEKARAEEAARRFREAEAEERARLAEAKRLEDARTEVARLSRQALVWGVAGLVFSCFPVVAVVAIVLGVRARRAAARYGVVAGGASTAGIALGGGSIAVIAGLLAIGIAVDRDRSKRAKELEHALAGHLEDATLSHETACGLVEHHLVTVGVKGDKPLYDQFQCDGALDASGDHATLHDVRIVSSSGVTHLEASFKRGRRWMVDDVVAEGGAPTAMQRPAPSASGRGR